MYDLLIEWCSEREGGSINQFRETHDWLTHSHKLERLEYQYALTNLEQLGHLEVDYAADKWAICPPALTAIPDSGGLALLTGARPRALMKRIRDPENDSEPKVRDLALRIWMDLVPEDTQKQHPSTLYLANPDDDLLRQMADALGIGFEYRASQRIASVLPTLDSYLEAGVVPAAPFGFEPRRMSIRSRVNFDPTDSDRGPGAYEYRRYGPPRYLFNDGTRLFQCDRRIVVYAELRRTKQDLLCWDNATHQMYVPGTCGLPLLYARCAVMCSGRLPSFTRSARGAPHSLPVNGYQNVPRSTFQTICQRLNQAPTVI